MTNYQAVDNKPSTRRILDDSRNTAAQGASWTLCTHPNAHVYYDDLHGSAAVHRLMAQDILRTMNSVGLVRQDLQLPEM
jgi:phospholipase/lecithinase/hemolysin